MSQPPNMHGVVLFEFLEDPIGKDLCIKCGDDVQKAVLRILALCDHAEQQVAVCFHASFIGLQGAMRYANISNEAERVFFVDRFLASLKELALLSESLRDNKQ